MLAEIITIGDELLIGQTVDTNSAWIAQKLNEIGIAVKQISSVSDTREHILTALDEAKERADIILITGGLGPTKDDITKYTLCEYFDSRLVLNEEVLKVVTGHFTSRGYVMPEVNKGQAMIPDNCKVLINKLGTASGMLFEKGEKIFVSMPGVPYEMKGLMREYVIPHLMNKNKSNHIIHHSVLTIGIGESFLMELIQNWENSLEKEEIKLAYLPSFGSVKLRLSKAGTNRENIQTCILNKVEELKQLIPNHIYGENDDTLQSVIGSLLKKQGATLSTAESCTGGNIAHLITSIPGSSEYYKGSIISYSNEIKIEYLGVEKSDIEMHGAVSRQVVEQMAKGVLRALKTDYSIATSGVAGPDGGTSEKPVGMVWIAIASSEKVVSKVYQFGKSREKNIINASKTALNLLRKEFLVTTK